MILLIFTAVTAFYLGGYAVYFMLAQKYAQDREAIYHDGLIWPKTFFTVVFRRK